MMYQFLHAISCEMLRVDKASVGAFDAHPTQVCVQKSEHESSRSCVMINTLKLWVRCTLSPSWSQ